MARRTSLQSFDIPANIMLMSKDDFITNFMTYNEDEDEYTFKKLDGKDLIYICQGSVGGDWVKEQLEKENVITHVFLSFDTANEKTLSPRGISMINIDKKKKNIKIVLLCNSLMHKMKTRSETKKPTGKNLMTTIIALGNHMKFKTISLDAINDVVSYYAKVYGFDWIKKNTRGTDRKEEIKQLAKISKQRAKNKEDVKDSDIGRRFGALGLKKGFYKEEDLREALPTQEDFEDEDDNILDTLGAKKDLWLNLGAPMVLNLNSRVGRKSKKKKKRNTNKTKRRRRRKK
tara:strand:+ start:7205 stop:8068 length:864 start_codon:yes stop_codon:yes gene_type:complete